ncbi:unnamed protein product [Arctia plantaginis]|uniref:HAT C-terminal dimerisation domain-containing protein n=1 Tax=Arctia plantaginis TaxID=874455 RepID=A0A8S0YXY7_ARCPL|nr:unnamed protein product [Arctia plantaginis]
MRQIWQLKENLLDLSADGMLQLEYKTVNLDTFWFKRKSEYPELTTEALKCLIPFATSYLFELTFSSMAQRKSKKRNRLEEEACFAHARCYNPLRQHLAI